MKRYTLSFDVETDAGDSDLLEELETLCESFQLPYGGELEVFEETATVRHGLTDDQNWRRQLVQQALAFDANADVAGKQADRAIRAGNDAATDFYGGKEIALRGAAVAILRLLDIPTPLGVPVVECVRRASERKRGL